MTSSCAFMIAHQFKLRGSQNWSYRLVHFACAGVSKPLIAGSVVYDFVLVNENDEDVHWRHFMWWCLCLRYLKSSVSPLIIKQFLAGEKIWKLKQCYLWISCRSWCEINLMCLKALQYIDWWDKNAPDVYHFHSQHHCRCCCCCHLHHC